MVFTDHHKELAELTGDLYKWNFSFRWDADVAFKLKETILSILKACLENTANVFFPSLAQASIKHIWWPKMQIERIFQMQLNMLGIFIFHYFQKQITASSII